MCGFVAAMMGAQALTGVMSIMGQQQQAKAQRDAANYNAKIAENNALIAERNVRKQQIEGARQEEEQRLKTLSLMGQQRAGYGASGFDVNMGSAVDVQANTAFFGQEDVLSIRAGSKAQEDRLHQQATDFSNKAIMDRASGRNAQRAANLASVGTAIGTLTSMASFANSQGLFSSGGGAGAKSPWVDPDTMEIK